MARDGCKRSFPGGMQRAGGDFRVIGGMGVAKFTKSTRNTTVSCVGAEMR